MRGLLARWTPRSDVHLRSFLDDIDAKWRPTSRGDIALAWRSVISHLVARASPFAPSPLPVAFASLPLLFACLLTSVVYPVPHTPAWGNTPEMSIAFAFEVTAAATIGALIVFRPFAMPRRTLRFALCMLGVGASALLVLPGPDRTMGIGSLYLVLRASQLVFAVGAAITVLGMARDGRLFARGWQIIGVAALIMASGESVWTFVFLFDRDVAWCLGSLCFGTGTAIAGTNMLDFQPRITANRCRVPDGKPLVDQERSPR